jgi:hypothetical protein
MSALPASAAVGAPVNDTDFILESEAKTIGSLIAQRDALWDEMERCRAAMDAALPEPPQILLDYNHDSRPLLYRARNSDGWQIVDPVAEYLLNCDRETWTVGEPRDPEVAGAFYAWQTAREDVMRRSGSREAADRYWEFAEQKLIERACETMAARPAAGPAGFMAKLKAIEIAGGAGSGPLWLSDFLGGGLYGDVPDALVTSALNDAVRLLRFLAGNKVA